MPPSVFKNTCTIGTVNTRATDALAVVLSDSPHAAPTPGPFIRCSATAISDTTMNTVPGT